MTVYHAEAAVCTCYIVLDWDLGTSVHICKLSVEAMSERKIVTMLFNCFQTVIDKVAYSLLPPMTHHSERDMCLS